jgi:hypothetical protein
MPSSAMKAIFNRRLGGTASSFRHGMGNNVGSLAQGFEDRYDSMNSSTLDSALAIGPAPGGNHVLLRPAGFAVGHATDRRVESVKPLQNSRDPNAPSDICSQSDHASSSTHQRPFASGASPTDQLSVQRVHALAVHVIVRIGHDQRLGNVGFAVQNRAQGFELLNGHSIFRGRLTHQARPAERRVFAGHVERVFQRAFSKNISVQHPMSCCATAARWQKAVATASLVHFPERMFRRIPRPSVVFVMANSSVDRIPQDSITGRQSLKSLGMAVRRQSAGIDDACCARLWRAVSLQAHIIAVEAPNLTGPDWEQTPPVHKTPPSNSRSSRHRTTRSNCDVHTVEIDLI